MRVATKLFQSSFSANGAGPAGQERAVGAAAADTLEGLLKGIEDSNALNQVGTSVAGVVSQLLPPGKMKDVVSGTWLGHPAHPMLTDVPIGAWTSALVLDLIGGRRARKGADKLIGIGILAAVPTAVSGLSELADLGTDPERSLATAHGLGNTAALSLYCASYVARKVGARTMGVALSTAATALMMGSAYVGGHLSFRKGIGVNHLAFEWRVDDWTPVCAPDELADGEAKLVQAGGNDVLLYRNGAEVCALADKCMHAGGPLHEGTIEKGRVTCPWHASRFNLADGSLVQGPATAPQPSYDTRVSDGMIEVKARS